jgi:hypothetical protein
MTLPAGSSLGDLARGQPTRSTSLPAALNGLRNCSVQRPLDSSFDEVMDSSMPAQQAPAPRPLAYQTELDAYLSMIAMDGRRRTCALIEERGRYSGA